MPVLSRNDLLQQMRDEAIASGVPQCELCGDPGVLHPVTIVLSREETTALCSLCDRLIEQGFFRAETVDGEKRYREWKMPPPQPWTPGELVPKVERA